MLFFDAVCCAAYAVFLAGESLYCRGQSSARGLWLMVGAVVCDFCATILPNTGCKALAVNLGAGPAIVAAIVLGVCVWMVFLGAVFVRLMGREWLFSALTAATKILWFVVLALCFYGVYNFQP